MKKIIASALLMPLFMLAQNNDKACDVFFKINNVLQTRHIKPKPIDDSLSVYVFNTVIENLDDKRTLFLQEEYDSLAKHKYKIDDYLKNRDCAFFTDFITIYKKALNRQKEYINELSQLDIPYATEDTIHYSKKAYPYQKKAESIKRLLRKKIIYETLEDVAQLSKNRDSIKALLPEIAKASGQKVTESLLCRLDLLLEPSEGFENSVYNNFFSVFCSYFDPHSTYFNYNQRASFVSSIATDNYSLGLYVSKNDKQEIIVEEIIPGGPAYKTQRIDKGDRIIKLAANDMEYTVTCSSMDAINAIVNSDSFKIVELTLRKNDGTVYSVNLEKKIMKADDHSVYSYVVKNDDLPVGYIKIPSFYTTFNSYNPEGCADDVAKEIIKLKKENIKGLIIDLQYNGGGSMEEVIRLCGMFINFGPMSVIVDKNDLRNIVKDYNRGALYTGPMVVLVNGFSASASEFFAGVMQDYGRAVIAGNQTLGKATMQAILPLTDDEKQDEFVKVTIDKFYRVTGKSSQYNGILPDVKLPFFFDNFLPRESSMPTAIENDSIDIKLKFKRLKDIDLNRVIYNSLARVEQDSIYKKINEVNLKIENLYLEDKLPLPLTFDAVYNDVHSMDDIWEEITTVSDTELNIKVKTVPESPELKDEFLKSANDQKIKSLKTDPHIYEGINIIKDILAQGKYQQ